MKEIPLLINNKKIEVWFDGACEPCNPGGKSTFGVIIKVNGKTILEYSGYECEGKLSSNNVAEYSGLIYALEYLLKNKMENDTITVKGDSSIVINQMFGTWKIKGGLYAKYARKAKRIKKKFSNITGFWIPREQNWLCDRLSRKE